MRICIAAAEVAPFAKTGGLGDVAASVALYLHRRGHDVRLFLPLYGRVNLHGQKATPVAFAQDVPVQFGDRTIAFSLFAARLPGTGFPVHLVACPALYGRNEIYSNRGDEHLRYAMLSRAALESCQRMGWSPHVVHAHDWHTALLPLYVKSLYAWDRLFHATKSVLTIHNLAYQGVFPASVAAEVGLGGVPSLLHQDDLRGGRFGFLKTGILYADAVTTVSETYAREIQGPEHGMGLDALLRARTRSVVGIVNGIDADVWSPEKDAHIPHRYSARDLSGKARNKRHLLESLGLAYDPAVPVFGIVSRLTSQKGFDLCFDVLPRLLHEHDVRLVVLGSGDSRYADFFGRLERAFPRKARYRTGYDEPLAHLIEAGADVFLMPSRFEPCGLNQMYSLRYGTPPVVRRTGGLADTVEPWNPDTQEGTGFVFDHATPAGLDWAIGVALRTWRDQRAWRRLQQNGMARDFSWDRQIRNYETLYASLDA